MAEAVEIIRLWEGPAPLAVGGAPGDIPALEVFPAPGPGPGLLVCPAGGYARLSLAPAREVAAWLAEKGIHAFVLRYRVAPYRHPCPLLDAQRALRLLRHQAGRLGLDPGRLGVLGFSAGAHLACCAATHFNEGDLLAPDEVERKSCRPDLQVLVAPVVTMGAKAHAGSKENLLGPHPDSLMVDYLSGERQAGGRTPPAFLAVSNQDHTVRAQANAEPYALALQRASVPHELFRADMGEHGFGLRPDWAEACLEWLRKRGF